MGMLSDEEARAVRALPLQLQCLDASGLVVAPGFVDLHVHITGGGGEAGGSLVRSPLSVCTSLFVMQATRAGHQQPAELQFQVSKIGGSRANFSRCPWP